MRSKDLTTQFFSEAMATRALLAFLAQTGNALWLLDIVDAADDAGVSDARDLADAIRSAARKVGIE